MSPVVLLLIVFAYFLFYSTFRTEPEKEVIMKVFIGNRNSNWMLVAFGMIGTSLSGVTFVSVPGAVGKDNFSYLQITLGYLIGYIIIAYVLLPTLLPFKSSPLYTVTCNSEWGNYPKNRSYNFHYFPFSRCYCQTLSGC